MKAEKTRLQPGSWQPEPSSLVDDVGRVIHYEGRVLRGIRREFAGEIPAILRLAERDRWFDHGLVRTWETDLETDEFPLIIEHERIPFVTVRGEWPAEALRRAACSHLDLSLALARSGYCLKDAHTWNLLFDGTTPQMVYFGSIRPLGEMHWDTWLRELQKYFLAPLLLFAEGESKLARSLMAEHLVGVGTSLLDQEPARLLGKRAEALTSLPWEGASTLEVLRDQVAGLTFRHQAGEWTAYAQPAGDEPGTLRAKDRLIAGLLDRLPFRTAIDLGANRGLHAFAAAERGADVLACDIDETCLDAVFAESSARRSTVLPLYLNLLFPAGAGGVFQTIAPATERLRCDLAIALALVHHVCLRWQLAPAAFARAIADFTSDAAIIEFVPADDEHVAAWDVKAPPGYSIDGMQRTLGELFSSVERLRSDPAPRCLFVCRGKR